jgi:hypothetical protein
MPVGEIVMERDARGLVTQGAHTQYWKGVVIPGAGSSLGTGKADDVDDFLENMACAKQACAPEGGATS